jgi:hypothetical protein
MATNTPTVPSHRPMLMPLLLFLALAAASIALLLGSALLAGSSLDFLRHPLDWLTRLDPDIAFDSLGNAAEVIAAVLAVVITVVAIVVELAANRYSHLITRMFLREPINLMVLGLLVLTTLQCLWAAVVIEAPDPSGSATSAILPHAGIVITAAMVSVSLLLLVPYIYFVFTFLSPISVIERICRDAYRVILRTNLGNVPRSQQRVEEAIDELQDVARSAITHGDRSISMAAVDALAALVCDYATVRGRMPPEWFDITETIAEDPDFVALAPETMEEVRREGVWLERKVLRRYLSLMGQSAVHARDVANLVGINTRRIAIECGDAHPHLLELCIRTFNSYLRTTIGATDPRTTYFLMNQYRLIAERLLESDSTSAAVTIAGHLGWYGRLAHRADQQILLEIAAYDIVQIIERALELESPAVDALLDHLLELDQEIREEHEEASLLGVRRSQMQLAALFLQRGDEPRTQRIVRDLAEENMDRLERLRHALMTDDRSQYWELMDRGANFSYLAPERRGFLDDLFDRIASVKRGPD